MPPPGCVSSCPFLTRPGALNRKLLWGWWGMASCDSGGPGPEKHKGRGSRLKGFQPELRGPMCLFGHSWPCDGSTGFTVSGVMIIMLSLWCWQTRTLNWYVFGWVWFQKSLAPEVGWSLACWVSRGHSPRLRRNTCLSQRFPKQHPDCSVTYMVPLCKLEKVIPSRWFISSCQKIITM